MSTLHQMNGALLTAVKRLLAPLDLDWTEWIVNTIVLRRDFRHSYSVDLKTSATLFRGKPYVSDSDCDEQVTALDAAVPLDASFAGYCLRTGANVWVDDLAALERDDPLSTAYRSFSYVGVSAPQAIPLSEYVFPIRTKIGLVDVALGVLNLEWYGSSNQPILQIPQRPLTAMRTTVTAKLSGLLDIHGVFLSVCLSLPDLLRSSADADVPNAIGQPLLECHASALEEFETANRIERLENPESSPDELVVKSHYSGEGGERLG